MGMNCKSDLFVDDDETFVTPFSVFSGKQSPLHPTISNPFLPNSLDFEKPKKRRSRKAQNEYTAVLEKDVLILSKPKRKLSVDSTSTQDSFTSSPEKTDSSVPLFPDRAAWTKINPRESLSLSLKREFWLERDLMLGELDAHHFHIHKHRTNF